MTKKPPSLPPGLKLSTEALAEVGIPRVCDQCGTESEVNYRNYAPNKKGLRGWCLTCRKCQGRAGGVLTYNKEPDGTIANLPDPAKDLDKFLAEIDRLVDRLHELANLGKLNKDLRKEHDSITRTLTAATRLHSDPAGGGRMLDERVAFLAFLRVTRPLVPDFVELGAVHDTIIDGLLCHDPNVVILASRGVGKSIITSQLVVWWLWRNPLEMVLVVSKGAAHATKMLKAIKSYIELSPLLEPIRPTDDCLNSATQFEIGPAHGKLGMSASVTVNGLGGQITGCRATRIIGDDIETPSNCATPEQVDSVQEAIGEFTFIATPKCEIKYLGTPHSVFSLYGRLSRSDAYRTFRACVFMEDWIDDKLSLYSLWPERFTESDLLKKKGSVSKQAWELQYKLRLDDTMAHERPLLLRDLVVLDWPSESPTFPLSIRGGGPRVDGRLPTGAAGDDDYWRGPDHVSEDTGLVTQTVMAVDPAGGLRSSGDAIGVAVVSVTQGGKAILRAARGVRAPTTMQALHEVASLAHRYSCNRLLVEENVNGLFGQQLSAVLMSRGYALAYERVATGGIAKGRRIIETLSPVMATGRLVVLREVLEHDDGQDFVNQLTSASYDGRVGVKHDDILDAVSYAVGACANALSVDEAEALAAARLDFSHLANLPARRGGLPEELVEVVCERDEREEVVTGRLEHCLEVQRQEIARGYHDPSLAQRIEALNAELQKLRTGRLQAPYQAVAPSPFLGDDF